MGGYLYISSYRTVCVYTVQSVGVYCVLAGFANGQFIRKAVKWVHIYARSVVFEVYSLRFSAVSGHFWW